MEINHILNTIKELQSSLNALRPLDSHLERRIMQKFRLDWNYHSNNIEGNTLTYGETKTFILHGLTAQGKPLKDHLDIKGHNEAIYELEDIVARKISLTETTIKQLHQIILSAPYEANAVTLDGLPTTKIITPGRYKVQPNHIETDTGETFYFSTPEDTPIKMEELVKWYNSALNDNAIDPVVLAAQFHYKFVRIHPFDDGNGRMARLLMNLALMTQGFPPVIIKSDEKETYYRSLRQADGGDEEVFTAYIGEQLIRSLELILKAAKGENIDEPDDFDKRFSLLKLELEPKLFKRSFSHFEIKNVNNEIYTPIILALSDKLNPLLDYFKSHTWGKFKYHSPTVGTDYIKELQALNVNDLVSSLSAIDSNEPLDYACYLNLSKLKVDGIDCSFALLLLPVFDDFKFSIDAFIINSPNLAYSEKVQIASQRKFSGIIQSLDVIQIPKTPYDLIVPPKSLELVHDLVSVISNRILIYVDKRVHG